MSNAATATATATATACDLTILMDLENPDREPTCAQVTGALRAAMAGAEQNQTNDAVPDADGFMAAWGTATALERRRCSSSASASAARPKFEARFFFTKHARQNTGVVLLGNVDVHDRGDDALRAEAHKLIVGDPSGEALKMVETHMVVVDVGLHKDSGGLGASYPQETLILRKPDHHG